GEVQRDVMTLEPPAPGRVRRRCAEHPEVIVLGIATIGPVLEPAEYLLQMHDPGGLQVALRAGGTLQQRQGGGALLQRHLAKWQPRLLHRRKEPLESGLVVKG